MRITCGRSSIFTLGIAYSRLLRLCELQVLFWYVALDWGNEK